MYVLSPLPLSLSDPSLSCCPKHIDKATENTSPGETQLSCLKEQCVRVGEVIAREEDPPKKIILSWLTRFVRIVNTACRTVKLVKFVCAVWVFDFLR